MKMKIYLRTAKLGHKGKVQASIRPLSQHVPLNNSNGSPLPTVAFALELDIPDALFRRAEEVVATLRIPEDAAHVAAEVSLP